MNRMQAFFNRQHGLSNDQTYDFALKRLSVAKEDSWRGIQPSNFSSDYNPEPPIFSAKFANCDGYRHILAIANEDGKIALQNTMLRNKSGEERALHGPHCHYNAVFDLEWAPDQMKFVSASGDHTARLWQVDGATVRNLRTFVGHTRSVKTAAFRREDSTVFATGGRDGAIIIWDTRAALNVDRTPRADNCIYSGHTGGPATPGSRRPRSRVPKCTAAPTSSSITGLAFQDTNTLISCGAGDGLIKVWDLRRNYTAYKKEPLPKHSLPYAGSSTFKGFTNLVVDSSGSRLYANCMDNKIYCYNLFSYSPKPLATYKGLMNSTFYIKSCLSPDEKYLLSGSSDDKAYIWNLKHPDEPLVALIGHSVEVTCVAWSATHDTPIVTCSDDARHKIWRIGPADISAAELAESYRGHAEYVRQFKRKTQGSTHKYNLRNLEATPRSLRHLVQQNERTPSSAEKLTAKRSFLDMLGSGMDCSDNAEPEQKRTKTGESKGRRLFSPSKSASNGNGQCLHLSLNPIAEEPTCSSKIASSAHQTTSPLSRHQMLDNENNQENTAANHQPTETSILNNNNNKTPHSFSPSECASPLSERPAAQNNQQMFTSPPPNTMATPSPTAQTPQPSHPQHHQQQQSLASVIFSPTSNLPNYVVDGEAPHLSVMSPKRSHKDNVDWLTKIRKQKLTTSRGATSLVDKFNAEDGATDPLGAGGMLASPRLQSLRNLEGSPRLGTPRRRTSHCHEPLSPSNHPKTPTSSRRNSETSILRFFTKCRDHDQQQQHTEMSGANVQRPSGLAATPEAPTQNAV